MSNAEDGILLTGLDGGNPLAFLAALGTLRVISLALPKRNVRVAWKSDLGYWYPILYATQRFTPDAFVQVLCDHLEHDVQKHPVSFMELLHGSSPDYLCDLWRNRSESAGPDTRGETDWLSALTSDMAPRATSQLQTARRDYFFGNMRSIMSLTQSEHLHRTLFHRWDYADPLENRSLHLEPSEDRRHAYQWHEPNGDPTRKKRGGMIGANRLAIEAFPFFQAVPAGDRMSSRGFTGNRSDDTRWTWPIWSDPLNESVIGSLLAMAALQAAQPDPRELRSRGVVAVYRSYRILVGKTPNFTPAQAI